MKKMFTSRLTGVVFLVILSFSISSIQAQTPGEPCPSMEINFNDYTVEIVPTRPDGGFEIQDAGATFKLIGNSWRQIDQAYEVTPNTVLEFEFRSDQQGNRHGLGFYNTSESFAANLDKFFQLYGSSSGLTLFNYNNYGGTQWVTYRIPVGQFYQGSFDRLAFMNSNHQSGSNGNSYFRNISISEEISGSCTTVNGNPGFYEDCQCAELTTCPTINFDNYAILPYGVDESQDGGDAYVQDAGQTLMIVENAWKSIMFNYTVTSNTIMDFDFKSTAEGEIHGIGLDDDANQTDNRTFQLFGTQSNFGVQTFNDYTLTDDWKSYSIPVGTFTNNTGERTRLFFVGDDDDAPSNANSFFRSVKIYEDGTCYPDCIPPSFSCAAPITETADANGEALVNFAAMAEGTNLEIAYQYLGQPITSPATFSIGVHHIIATATNDCGAAISDCLTITVLSCRDNDASQNYDDVPGFGPWIFNHTDNAGNFIASSTENGDGDDNSDGDINTTGAFGLFANGGGEANMIRPFINPLLPGETFSVDFDNGWIDGGSVGIGLQNASGENLIEFYFVGGQPDYKLSDANGVTGTGFGFTDEGLALSFSLKNGGIVNVDITNLNDGLTSSYTQTLSNPAGGQDIAQLRFFNFNAGEGPQRNAYINSLSLCQSLIDADGDGFSENEDCDDNNAAINPGAEEIYFDGIDNDCNPETSDENSGIFESYVILNGVFYDLKASTDLPDFTGEIGTYGCDAPLVLDGAQNKTFKCPQGNGDILNGKLFYRIYPQGDAPGSFSELGLIFNSDDDVVFGCQNQTWQTDNAAANISNGLDPDIYVIEVYTGADYTFTGGDGSHLADNSGSNFVATFSIADNTPPIAIAQNVTVQLDASGNASTTAEAVDNGSNDACGIASLALSQTEFDCLHVGSNNVDLTVTDVNGNESVASAVVTVEDNVAPVAIAQNVTIQLDASGNGSTTAEAADNGSNDACGIASLALSQTAFDCTHVGANNVVLTVTDVNGNESVASAVVTVEDNVAPVAIAQNVTVQLDASGNASTTAEAVNNGSNDACGIESLALSQTEFDCLHVGANNVVLTVTDVNGNENTANAFVTVEDNVAPVAIAQNVTIQLDASGNGSTTAEAADNGSNDACGIASLALSQTAFDCTHVGANNVVLTVTDVNGNENTANAFVTVEDNVAPVAIAQNVTIQLDASGNGSTTAEAVNNGSNDACGIASLALSQTEFDCLHVGANNVDLTVTDVNGNESVASAFVTVEDNVAPVAIAQNVTVQLDASGNGSTTAEAVDNGSNDACGIASLALSQTEFDCLHVGANNVDLTVTDVNGNESVANAFVTVEDNVAPVAIAQNVTIQLDASGNGSTTAEAADNGSNDACGIASLALSQTAFDCTHVGANNVVLTVTDVNGNENTANAFVTVEDNVAPVAIAQNVTIQLDASGNASTTAEAVDNGSNDACGIASLALSQTEFDCLHVGANNVDLTVTDVNGNESVASAVVTVEDNVAPVAIAQNVTIQLDASGNASTTAEAVNNGSNDACGIESLALSQTEFDCLHVGANNVVLTVTDVNGNENTANAFVTVEDNVAPVAIAQNVTIQLDASGNGSTTAEAVNNGSNDACGIASLALSQTEFDCLHVGANNVDLTVTDVNGNESTANVFVTVEDNVAPTAVCQDITVQLDASGFGSIEAAQVDGGSTDNCSVASLSLDQSSFDCTNAGGNIVELTVTDASGNTATCNALVTVLEPLVLPSADIASSVALTDSGNVVIFDNVPTSIDLPESVVLTASLSPLDFNVGSYQWAYRDVPDGLFVDIEGATDAALTIESDGDSHREYRVEILTVTGCEASATMVVFSVDVSCKGNNKVRVCHVPPGNPDNAKEICVNVNAVPALLANSDSYLGSCDLGQKSVVKDEVDPDLQVYPNPSWGRFIVTFKEAELRAEQVYVFDMQGRKVMSVAIQDYTGAFQIELNLSEHENGMYMMTIVGAGQVIASERIMKTQ